MESAESCSGLTCCCVLAVSASSSGATVAPCHAACALQCAQVVGGALGRAPWRARRCGAAWRTRAGGVWASSARPSSRSRSGSPALGRPTTRCGPLCSDGTMPGLVPESRVHTTLPYEHAAGVRGASLRRCASRAPCSHTCGPAGASAVRRAPVARSRIQARRTHRLRHPRRARCAVPAGVPRPGRPGPGRRARRVRAVPGVCAQPAPRRAAGRAAGVLDGRQHRRGAVSARRRRACMAM